MSMQFIQMQEQASTLICKPREATRLTANPGAAHQKNVYTIQQSLNLFPDNL